MCFIYIYMYCSLVPNLCWFAWGCIFIMIWFAHGVTWYPLVRQVTSLLLLGLGATRGSVGVSFLGFKCNKKATLQWFWGTKTIDIQMSYWMGGELMSYWKCANHMIVYRLDWTWDSFNAEIWRALFLIIFPTNPGPAWVRKYGTSIPNRWSPCVQANSIGSLAWVWGITHVRSNPYPAESIWWYVCLCGLQSSDRWCLVVSFLLMHHFIP